MRSSSVIGLSLLVLASCSSSASSTTDASSSSGTPTPVTTASPDASSSSATDPKLLMAAYVSTDAGPRILAAGSDPSARLESVLFELQDADGNPAVIVDGNGYTEQPEIEIARSAMTVAADGSFFVEIQSSRTLASAVAKITATARDIDGVQGTTLTSVLAPLPVRQAGDACSTQGFDVCATGLVCADSAHCVDLAAARAARCALAPAIAIGGTLNGTASGASLWDPIDGCASADRRGRPEAVVRLHLDAAAASVTIRTLAGTAFDSVVSVLGDCGATPTTLACNDDDPPPMSRVALTGLAAGDYLVVVDALDRAGGAFVLAATAP